MFSFDFSSGKKFAGFPVVAMPLFKSFKRKSEQKLEFKAWTYRIGGNDKGMQLTVDKTIRQFWKVCSIAEYLYGQSKRVNQNAIEE